MLQTQIHVKPPPADYCCSETNFNADNPPNTGVTRVYDFTIRRQARAPDGYPRDFLTINSQFPGPLIEANWGDTIQVTVHNLITGPSEGTALHWHGILQKESQWMDGVPGVQQCPIPPGGSFTYSFQADLYGTTWYHGHYSAQYASGLLGPMVIYGPDNSTYDTDMGPVLLTDHYHTEYYDIIANVMSTNITKALAFSDNNLIQGRNNFDCSTVPANQPCASNAGLTAFKFTAGKTHRLRLINAGAEAIQKFSIDGHTMSIIANDFVPIVPYTTQGKVVTLGVGQRTDVIVTGIAGATGSYLMRSTVAACSLANGGKSTAIVYYGTTAPSIPPTTTAWPKFLDSVQNQCANDDLSLTRPLYSITPDPKPPTTQNLDIEFGQNATGFWVWTMNKVSFRTNYNAPILLLSNAGNNSYPQSPQWNVYNFGSNSSIRFVITNPGVAAHPMHLHGHNFFVLAVGTGTWDGKTVVNAANPQRRDVQIVPAGGYLVMQITADNPGVWPLHCHIAWHVSAGLYITVVERPNDIAKLAIPSVVAQTCRDWATFTGTTVIDQIDSGLKMS
ncbi:oxidoreductase ptaK [Lachnellula suecica]|uniref:Oxidoreductase ptaK n=1 Tax=Lachnellula suecica TaxID=602035 RepID=A0A8T9C5K0_9HELO|nr:oxidoreductase ptaK [Lachnellula suecica]